MKQREIQVLISSLDGTEANSLQKTTHLTAPSESINSAYVDFIALYFTIEVQILFRIVG